MGGRFLGVAAFCLALCAPARAVERPPQFVVMAFDNCTELERWKELSEFAADMNRSGEPLHFTFFVSGINFLADDKAGLYQPPNRRRGASQIGFGGTPPPSFTVGRLAAKRSATGAPLIVVTVQNSGEGPLDISGSLTLSDGPGGMRGGPYPVTLGPALAPGQSELATAVLSKQVPDGPWKAAISLVSGPTVRSATATLTFPGTV